MALTGRGRTRQLLTEFFQEMRARHAQFDGRVVHALRELTAACYDLGYQDARRGPTIPAPPPEDAPPPVESTAYSIIDPEAKDKLP